MSDKIFGNFDIFPTCVPEGGEEVVEEVGVRQAIMRKFEDSNPESHTGKDLTIRELCEVRESDFENFEIIPTW